MFADVGDTVFLTEANTLSLTVDGPEAGDVPPDMDNSTLQAIAMLDTEIGVAVELTKFLPVSSGIGGGSADAAAAFRGILDLWEPSRVVALFPGGLVPEKMTASEIANWTARFKTLGADFPVCLLSHTARMRGIGNDLNFMTLPQMHAVLVNPRVPVSTPEIFARLESKENAPMADVIPVFLSSREFCDWLGTQRNDLQTPALAQVPDIHSVLDALWRSDCLLARMSGSGATCFGLYPDGDTATIAARQLSDMHPGWWVSPCKLGPTLAAI